ncbi:MAG: PaaI family thioesterase [Alphaproteobacteria bacterium]
MTEPSAPIGALPRERIAAMSGLDMLRLMIAGKLPRAPFAVLTRINLVEADPGRVAFEGDVVADFANPMGVVHGGWTSTILDSAMACAVWTRLAPGQGQTTLELKVNCVRPVLVDAGRLRAEATTIHVGRQIATAEGRLTDSAGRLLAHATTTCMVFDLAKAG